MTERSGPSGTLTVSLENLGAQVTDPILQGRAGHAQYQAPIYDALLGFDYEAEFGGVGPGVAKEWSIDPDGNSWTFTLEEDLVLDGIPLRLIDTAGLRPVADPVESEGVQRAHRAREEADLVLLVLDGSRDLAAEDFEAIERGRSGAEACRTVVIVNKCDLPGVGKRTRLDPAPQYLSALTGQGVEALRAELRNRLLGSGPVEDPVITNSRHALALEQSRDALDHAAEAVEAGLSEELVLEDLKLAMQHLGQITGEFTTEDLYDRIFSTFCIGK